MEYPYESLIAPIQRYLEEHGWEPEGGEGWVSHRFDNDFGELRVNFTPSSPRLYFQVYADEAEANLLLEFADKPNAVLEVIVAHQDKLSDATWPEFARAIAQAASKISELSGEDGEIETVLKSPDDVVDALQTFE